MLTTIEFLLRHGYVVLLFWVFAEQAGFPIPAMPILLAAGALAGDGRMNLPAALLVCVLAAVTADSLWFQFGRMKGMQVLHLLCRISLEPDSCVRRTQGLFVNQGARSLVLAKFLPGLSTVAPPLAGIVRMRPWRFLLFDALGAVLWAGTFLGLGYAFSSEIERFAAHAESLGGWLGLILGGGFAGYLAYKLVARRRFLRELRIAQISVDELKSRIDSGEDIVIVDLRHSLDFEADPDIIPGALRMDAEELQQKNDRLPRDREVILYCT
jgi:membrane protein DedA with SNARE-associated domain